MRVSRLDLDGTGSPLGLVSKILAAEPELPIPVPVEELAYSLDIAEIQDLVTEGFDGGLVTDAARSVGGILVRRGMVSGRRRFTIGHELGHFLIPTHVLPSTGQFLCSAQDMKRWSETAQNRAATMEVEANRFSAALLMPAPHLKRFITSRADPSLEAALAVHEHFDVSKEAAARAYASFHQAPIAIAIIHGEKILRLYKGPKFPRLCVSPGSKVPKSLGSSDLGQAIGSPGALTRAAAEDWLESEWGVRMPALFQQVVLQNNGYATALLWCEMPDDDDEYDPDENKTAKERYRDRAYNSDFRTRLR